MDTPPAHRALQVLIGLAALAGVATTALGAAWFVLDQRAPESVGIGTALGTIAMALGLLLLLLAAPAVILVRRGRRSGHVLAILVSVAVLPVGFLASVFVPLPELGMLAHLLVLSYSVGVVVLAVQGLGRAAQPAG